jgi:transposase-like protein
MEKMDVIIKLIALNFLRDKNLKEKVKALSGLGLRPIEIARVIDKSQNYVNVTLHEIRKEEESTKETKPDLKQQGNLER